MNNSQHDTALCNLENLRRNSYPGRGLIIGLDTTGQYAVMVYWIMGRSDNSRNRIFETQSDGSVVRTKIADPSKLKPGTDTKLIIYNAMEQDGTNFVVSNGDQTDQVIRHMGSGASFDDSLSSSTYEPDAPNHTCRITAVHSSESAYFAQLSLLRKAADDTSCERMFFNYENIAAGFGRCLTTYAGDGDPLPPFTGEPLLMPLMGDLNVMAEYYWDALNRNNRVSIAVKFISLQTYRSNVALINKNLG